jgi:stage II sporulation protein D
VWVLAIAASDARAVEVVRIAVTVGAPRASLEGQGLACGPLAPAAAALPMTGGRADVVLADGALRLGRDPVAGAGLRCTADGPIRHGKLDLVGEVEVRPGAKGLDVVHALPMEEYVAAVAGTEMPPSFPPEALKAQAVAARTFAIAKKVAAVTEGRAWHLGATVVHQVYQGSARTDPRARAAADATAGEVLAHDHEPADAFFHAACGGRTETGAAALGRDRAYLPSVPCGGCAGSPLDRWTRRFEGAELGRALGVARAPVAVRVAERTASGRAARIEVEAGGTPISIGGADFRQRIGWSRLPSLAFEVRRERGAFVFTGRGAGHGAGLCQWGAAGLARDGLGYREILARYYPGAELLRMY